MTKPTLDPRWDTNLTNSADPGAALRLDGYAANDVLPSTDYNWLLAAHGQWLEWLASGGSAGIVRTSVWDAIDDTAPGDVVTVAHSDPLLVPITLDTEAGAPMGAGFVDTDGRYVVWVSGVTPTTVRVVDLDTLAVVTFAPSANNITSLACDGSTIACTDGTDLFTYTYAGALIGSAAQPNGLITDMKLGQIAVCNAAASTFFLYDMAPAVVVSRNLGMGNAPRDAKFAESGLVVVWTDVMAAYSVDLCDYAVLASTWTYALGMGGVYATGAVVGEEFRYVETSMMGAFVLMRVPLPPDLAPVPVTGPTIGNFLAYDRWVWTAHRLYGWAAGVGTAQSWSEDGGQRGIIPGILAGAAWERAACDGLDLVVCHGDPLGAAAYVSRVPIGARARLCRRYADTAWRPYCHSLLVED